MEYRLNKPSFPLNPFQPTVKGYLILYCMYICKVVRINIVYTKIVWGGEGAGGEGMGASLVGLIASKTKSILKEILSFIESFGCKSVLGSSMLCHKDKFKVIDSVVNQCVSKYNMTCIGVGRFRILGVKV